MSTAEDIGARTMSKIKWRILPFCLLLYVINFIDRQNIGIAALQMNKELDISLVQFGTLATAFFISYFIFEVPSNLLMHKVGANKWIARIMISWGLVVALTGLAQAFWHIYTLRFLLGLMEAGFFPGMIYYFTYWFPSQHRARAVAVFMLGLPLANIVGAPVATLIMDNISWFGLTGWRWVFVLEGVPAIIFGVMCLWFLTNTPDRASWLTTEEKNWLAAELAKEGGSKQASRHMSLKDVLSNPMILWLCFIFFAFTAATNCFGIWLPTILKEFSKASNTAVGVLLMIPYSVSAVCMYLWSWKSDKSADRRWDAAIPNFIAAFGLLVAGLGPTLTIKIIGIVIMVAGANAVNSPFWTLPASFLSGVSAAAGLAFINSFASLGGIFGNMAVGTIKQYSNDQNVALYFLAGCFVVAGLAIVALPKRLGMAASAGANADGAAASGSGATGGAPAK
jgi:ACS family tartrate transporter-like MFS transporter